MTLGIEARFTVSELDSGQELTLCQTILTSGLCFLMILAALGPLEIRRMKILREIQVPMEKDASGIFIEWEDGDGSQDVKIEKKAK